MPCLFCQIIAHELPAQIVYADEHTTAIRDLHPQAPTHLLVLPNRHLASVAEAQTEDEALLGHLLRVAAEMARAEGIAESGFRLVTNTGAHGGQSVFHLHIHLLGGRPMRWPPG
jgi:histidine triad (HIT) family protein